MIIVFINVVRTFLFGLFLAGFSGFMIWHSIRMHYAGVVIVVQSVFLLIGVLLILLAIRTADRALRTVIR